MEELRLQKLRLREDTGTLEKSHARLNMSYRGCPLVHLPPGARPGENLRRGDISIRHNDTVEMKRR